MNTFTVILGTIGFGIAFGLQNFVGEIISGMAILALKYFNLGDLIKIKDTFGYVKNFNLTNTTIITNLGEIIIVPNSLITSDLFINITKNKNIFVVVPAKISNTNKINYPEVLNMLKEKVKLSKYVIDKNEVLAIVSDMARVIETGEAGTTISVKAKIESVNYFNGLNDIKLIIRQTLEDKDIKLFDYY